MSRSSDRAATEPLAALVALFAVSAGVALYAGVLDGAIASTGTDRNPAEPTADAVERRVSRVGVLDPEGIGESLTAVPSGYDANVTVRVGRARQVTQAERGWSAGPRPPATAAYADRLVSVRVAPGTVLRGTLSVRVWR
ncbi:DUF7285 family protein [Haloarcula marina]|uniref:DUF7285 family protein n=1 Tax=Haloarcula marina TaxID=2961574 RepID=UPI0020B67979|nr:hypothetical protein [Halomicroarcula marina]